MLGELDRIVEELDRHRDRLERFCRSLSAEELERPVPGSTWRVRDFIAHLATIDRPVAAMFRSVRLGPGAGRPGDDRAFDVDAWNEEMVQERRTRTVEELFEEARRERDQLKAELLAFTAADLQKQIPFGGDAKRPAGLVPLGRYLAGWSRHDPIHVADMVRALPERLPEVADWIHDPVVDQYQQVMNQSQ